MQCNLSGGGDGSDDCGATMYSEEQPRTARSNRGVTCTWETIGLRGLRCKGVSQMSALNIRGTNEQR